MKTILSISTALLFTLSIAAAETFGETFATLKKANDKSGIEKLLTDAAKTESANPDYYATAGNYWWGVSQSISMPALKAGEYQLDPKDFSIEDPKTGKKVGAIGGAVKTDPELSKRALNLLGEGAKKFPQRADIVLGLAHVQKELGLADDYVKSLLALLETAKKDHSKLVWTKDEALPSAAEKFIPEIIQNYASVLFNANSPKTDELCAKLLDSITTTFPDHPYAYNMKAALADAGGKPDEALKMLEIAHDKGPTEQLILSNLANSYSKAGQKEKAIQAYEKLLKLKPDAKRRQKAETALKTLRDAK